MVQPGREQLERRAHAAAASESTNLSSVAVVDLLGNGTACIVWSSPLPGDDRRPMRYLDLMGGRKPHLMVSVVNNLGAEVHVEYVASTTFYLKDRRANRPWIAKLPFPVHVVEGVRTYDSVSQNRFVTRYAYHHGYYDGVEREFRGFGMVEQWDRGIRGAAESPRAFRERQHRAIVLRSASAHQNPTSEPGTARA